ncbi:putative transcription factor CG1-CAMTA family [Helianthus annuus]|nr:putative transcription factor CG1-CAMTA family [Helianthus annuus]
MEQPAALVGSEIHGSKRWKVFELELELSLYYLDMRNMMEEAKTRWLRPNEIHAVLCNHKYFNICVKPVNLPSSGTIVLFDRKMLRNFRKDGHNWKKKKDGKTVKEAHEHLKVGNNERIHVYYAHGEDRITFVRRCYWLLTRNWNILYLFIIVTLKRHKVLPGWLLIPTQVRTHIHRLICLKNLTGLIRCTLLVCKFYRVI